MTETSANSGSAMLKVLASRLGDREFCIAIAHVREIRGWTPTMPLPHAPKFVRGLVNLRGTVLPIIDLAELLGFPTIEPTLRSAIIVLEFGEHVFGLLVDGVTEILELQPDWIQPTPQIATDVAKSFVSGVVALEQRMISLIGVDSIVPHSAPAVA